MIPLKDDNPHSSKPVVTFLLIAINVLMFIRQLLQPEEALNQFVLTYGAVPARITQGQQLYSIVTSMFLHGGFMHLAGNMLYLYIFGDNVEALCGHARFLLFYLACGVVAFGSHYIFAPVSEIPMIGASGAISGVLGAYALRFPRARVYILLPIFLWIYRIFRVPAVLVLGIWFLLQLFSGVTTSVSGGGVAWFAHVGGFIAGLLLILVFEKNRYRVNFF
jgi:membrane associated rhomboid family serine protease